MNLWEKERKQWISVEERAKNQYFKLDLNVTTLKGKTDKGKEVDTRRLARKIGQNPKIDMWPPNLKDWNRCMLKDQ